MSQRPSTSDRTGGPREAAAPGGVLTYPGPVAAALAYRAANLAVLEWVAPSRLATVALLCGAGWPRPVASIDPELLALDRFELEAVLAARQSAARALAAALDEHAGPIELPDGTTYRRDFARGELAEFDARCEGK